MKFEDLKSVDKNHVANTYGRFDLGLSHGKGARVWDFDGKEYIDLGSGIGVNSLGFADETWIEAVTGQIGKLAHTSNLYYSEPAALVAEKLCQRTGMKKVFFANSGAEANEGAMKTARKYSLDKYGANRYTIVSLLNSFHGRTMATLSATGQDVLHKYFTPFLDGFSYAKANDWADTMDALDDTVCAVMIETIQGEGGVLPLDLSYVSQLQDYCREHDILLLVDEVQTGVGRTGTFLCSSQLGIRPDIVTLAKGLGGGLPIGAILFGEKCEKVLGPSDHGSTFGGNPVSCAGALAVLHKIDDALMEEVTTKGAYVKERLLACKNVESVDGKGLMLGIQLKAECPFTALELVKQSIVHGIIPLTAKDKIRLLPPLIISKEDLEKACDILCAVIDQTI